MEVNTDAVINGLLDEIKRLTLDNVVLKSLIVQSNHETSEDTTNEVEFAHGN